MGFALFAFRPIHRGLTETKAFNIKDWSARSGAILCCPMPLWLEFAGRGT
jgi:hypothetical protein